MSERHRLTDAQWERIAPVVPGKEGDPGRHGEDNRGFVEAVLWLCRTGAPWRDLPAEFGRWNSAWKRFSRWAKRGVWSRILEQLSEDPDLEHLIIDATIVRAHQHSAGGKGGLKLRRSADRAAARPRKSTSRLTRSAIRCASSSRLAKRTTARRPPR
jgi:putative transposase